MHTHVTQGCSKNQRCENRTFIKQLIDTTASRACSKGELKKKPMPSHWFPMLVIYTSIISNINFNATIRRSMAQRNRTNNKQTKKKQAKENLTVRIANTAKSLIDSFVFFFYYFNHCTIPNGRHKTTS